MTHEIKMDPYTKFLIVRLLLELFVRVNVECCRVSLNLLGE
jgi:hypothetical protein